MAVVAELQAQHLQARFVAAYVESRLDADERAVAEEHLATCATCRREVVEVSRLLLKRRRASQLLPAVGIAAAAMLALVAGISLIGGPTGSDSMRDPVRAPSLTRSHALMVLEPAPDASLSIGADVRFVWNAAELGSTYRLVVLDESGGPVWATETSDTVAVLPASAGPERTGAYFWFVNALASDGSTLTSGARRFSLR